MLDIASEVKELYKQSSIPKRYSIVFSSFTITNDQLVAGGFSLEESLFSGNNIKFGSCVSGMVKFTVADVSEDLKGQEFTITQIIGIHEIPIGKFVVTECKKQNNKRFKEIIAYDCMRLFDKDVSGWYKDLTFPLTLAQFRASLLAYLGITEVIRTLPNDIMSVSKTIDPSQISGRNVIQACEEINGCFGHIDRNGNFKHIVLKTTHEDYPQDDFPDANYPEEEPYDEYIDMSQCINIDFEEYRVTPINKIQIRQEENDVGTIYGTGTNCYIIQGNFLVYGKSAAELQTIAANVSQNMFYRGYRPYKASNIGLPYVEVGDFIKYNANDTTAGFVFERTLSGVQGLRDEYSADGKEEITQSFGQSVDMIQQEGRMTKIEKSVDGIKISVSDLAEATEARFEITVSNILQEVSRTYATKEIIIGLLPSDSLCPSSTLYPKNSVVNEVTSDYNSKIEQTATSITDEVTRASRAEGKLSGQISVMAGEIELKVSSNEVVAAINLSPETIAIKANKINFSGYAEFNANGDLTSINGAVLKTGTVTADTVNANWVYANVIRADQITAGTLSGDRINGGTISGAKITSSPEMSTSLLYVSGTSSTTEITGLYVETTYVYASNISCSTVNGSAPLVSGSTYTNQITAYDTGYGNIDFLGFDNAAGVNWVQANFERITTSDIRLKCNIKSMEDIPDELFYALKPKQFQYKPETNYRTGVFFGLIAQQVASAFETYGLNPYDYDLIEKKDVKEYTDDGFYVKGETLRLHDKNLIGWMMNIIQNQHQRITQLENTINS